MHACILIPIHHVWILYLNYLYATKQHTKHQLESLFVPGHIALLTTPLPTLIVCLALCQLHQPHEILPALLRQPVIRLAPGMLLQRQIAFEEEIQELHGQGRHSTHGSAADNSLGE